MSKESDIKNTTAEDLIISNLNDSMSGSDEINSKADEANQKRSVGTRTLYSKSVQKTGAGKSKSKKVEKKHFKISEADEDDLPLVSVIMPVYNAENYLKNTLHSLIMQEYKKLEIICVNDGSTDNSLEILRHMERVDNRIIIIDQPNSGPAHARNAALDRAAGKYISFVDADDSTDPYMYYSLVEYAEDSDADIIVFGGTPFPDDKPIPDWIWQKLSPRFVEYEGNDKCIEALFHENGSRPFIWLHFIKRELIEQKPALRMNEDMDLGEDQLFQFMYFPRAKKVIFWDKRFYYYRWYHEGSLMFTYNGQRVNKYKKHIQIVEGVFKSWIEADYPYMSHKLVSWMVEFLYYDLVNFPLYLQHDFAKQIISICKKYDMPIYMCNEWEIEHGKEIEKLAEIDDDFESVVNEEIEYIKSQIDRTENEINNILASKTFKVGKMLTSRKQRLDISSVLPPVEKKN